jgi:hypothetical protein
LRDHEVVTVRDDPSPRYGIPPQARLELQKRVPEAIGAVSALRIQVDRMNGLLEKLGDAMGAAPHSDERIEQLLDIRAWQSSRFDQLEALRRDLADLMIDAPMASRRADWRTIGTTAGARRTIKALVRPRIG